MDLIELAEVLRDRGMSLATEAQDRKVPAWSQVAYEAIVRIAERQETVHVDNVIEAGVPAPAHPNAWGSVWMKAIKNGVIERTGTVRPSADPAKHKHNYPVYRSNIHRRSVA
jgi:hypothetical protein